MKKLLLLFSIFIFSLQANAQMWCAPGATWHYRAYFNMMPYYDGHIKLTVTNTVMINNVVCNDMTGSYTGRTGYSAGPIQTYTNFVNVKTYENNGIVYVYNTDSLNFDTIANFNAAIGAKWLGVKYPKSECFVNYTRPTITVIDTGHMVINSISLKMIKVSFNQPPSNTYTFTMVEKISALSGFLFPATHCIIDGPIFGNFVCYSDNNFPLYDPSAAVCDFVPTAIKENPFSYNSLKLFPNPNNGNFTIELEKPTSIKIYNNLGALVYENDFKQPGNFHVDLSSFAEGIYSVKAENADGLSYSKVIKQ